MTKHQPPSSQHAETGSVAARKIRGNVTINNYVAPQDVGPDEAALQRSWLNWVMSQCRPVSLSALDAATEDRQGPKMRLEEVYTGLLISGMLYDGRFRFDGEHTYSEVQLSAVGWLDSRACAVLLGKPGSGKSTFVNFVALCLAGELLGDPDTNLKRLTAPLPRDDGEDADEPQPWSHAALLPVPVVLRDFAAGPHLPGDGNEPGADALWGHIGDDLARCDKADYLPHLRRRMLNGEALLLLDGLDEVADADGRRDRVLGAIRAFAVAHDRARILVTARPYAYERPEWRLDDAGFDSAMLADFSDGQIRRFVRRWYARRSDDAADNAGRARLLERAVFEREGGRLSDLARRPLLLTLMAYLHAEKQRALPDKRHELYAQILDLLLRNWDAKRFKVDADGTPREDQPALTEYLAVGPAEVRCALERLAYLAHRDQGGKGGADNGGTADIAEKDLLYALSRIKSDSTSVNDRKLRHYLEHRSGVLTQRGPGVYTFPHRSFQEYLAACHLRSADFDFDDPALACLGEDALDSNETLIAALGRLEPDRWREAVLLAAAETEHFAWAVADELAPELPPGDWKGDGEPIADPDAWGARLAGQILLEATEPAKANRSRSRIRERVRDGQLAVMRRSRLLAKERCAAGDCLSLLGDIRFDPECWFLPAEPDLGFVQVPAGRFRMGQDDASLNLDLAEQPVHELALSAYWIGRWPVTVGQFRAFVEHSGQAPRDGRALHDPDSRPVRWIDWHEADAYCRWLQARLLELPADAAPRLAGALRDGRLRAALPSEPEWERAARGTDELTYPWAVLPGLADFESANMHGDIGDSGVVGCYPRGVSPTGCEDLSGNVWEWTRSRSGGYPYPPSGPERAEREGSGSGDRLRVLRGGSFLSSGRNCRAAARSCAIRLRLVDVGFRLVWSSCP
ncbi:SUMF1/EgtB/PvdO family nonheme iron enzyme [uncultured Thiohalocapsa sp.]|uniref:SUMF1/EgtB/PvdO family nonheme iron enzyme n=1 Tax=uncultured Thiohalocapsa sp. TaxID=768990 RepID=UPI0025DF0F63|nr:SUMF1/EgtB/PvdO family nonheme iron enzyme [uncultured Thiohalocapsa sp.]